MSPPPPLLSFLINRELSNRQQPQRIRRGLGAQLCHPPRPRIGIRDDVVRLDGSVLAIVLDRLDHPQYQ